MAGCSSGAFGWARGAFFAGKQGLAWPEHPWTFRTGVEVQAGGANLHKNGLPRGAGAVRFGWKEPGWAAQRSPGGAASRGTFTLCSGDVEEEVGLIMPCFGFIYQLSLGSTKAEGDKSEWHGAPTKHASG